MDRKLLFVASTGAHIRHFHLPYLQQLRASKENPDANVTDFCEHLGVRAAEAVRVASFQFFVISHCCSILWGGG